MHLLTKSVEDYKHVKCFGLHGTYDHALEWLKSSAVKDKPKTILWLGSSLGNFKRHEAAQFLAGFAKAIRTGDTMLIGIDSCKDPSRVYHAYNDSQNVTHDFILNGLAHANKLMGGEVFKLHEWKVIGEFDAEAGRHHAFVVPLKDVVVDNVKINQGERIRIEESYKYSQEEITRLWGDASLAENTVWSNSRGDYGEYSTSTLSPDKLLIFTQACTLCQNPLSSFLQSRAFTLHILYRLLRNGTSYGRHGMLSLAR